jgi:hypothetical protein
MVEMLALALGAALFAITAWWLLLAAVTAQLITSGMTMAGALLLIGIINVVLAVLAVLRIRKLSDNLDFATTRSALQASASPAETTPRAETTPPEETSDAVEPPPAKT